MADAGGRRIFSVHKHDASSLHYDLRLELDGVLKSWAIPKGPSLDPKDKRLAVQVEDHPLDYATFEGVIPEGEYGAGTVMLWDQGWWEPEGEANLDAGELRFVLHGQKLKGAFVLVQMKGRGPKNWLLIKQRDDESRPAYSVTEQEPNSVATGRSLEEIARAGVSSA